MQQMPRHAITWSPSHRRLEAMLQTHTCRERRARPSQPARPQQQQLQKLLQQLQVLGLQRPGRACTRPGGWKTPGGSCRPGTGGSAACLCGHSPQTTPAQGQRSRVGVCGLVSLCFGSATCSYVSAARDHGPVSCSTCLYDKEACACGLRLQAMLRRMLEMLEHCFVHLSLTAVARPAQPSTWGQHLHIIRSQCSWPCVHGPSNELQCEKYAQLVNTAQ